MRAYPQIGLFRLCLWPTVAGCLAVLWAGCSENYYRKEADHDAYRIVREKQREVTGATYEFTIEPSRPFEQELTERGFPVPDTMPASTSEGESRRPVVLAVAPREIATPQMSILFSPRVSERPVGRLVDMAQGGPARTGNGSPKSQPDAATTQNESLTTDLDRVTLPPVNWPKDLYVQPGEWPGSVRIDLIRALELAALNNRDYQTNKETVYQAALALTDQRHAFELQFFGTIDATLAQTDADTRNGAIDSALGFNRKFTTGGTMAASITNHLFEVFTDPSGKTANSTINMVLSQPLLRGAGYRVTIEPLLQADRNVTYAVRTFERFKRQLAISIASQFYDVVQKGDQVVNGRNNYAALMLAKQRTKGLADAGRLPGFEVDQAEQDELRARDQWVTAVQAYNQSIENFRRLLGLPTDYPVVPDQASLDRIKVIQFALLPTDQAVRTALTNRLDLKNVADQADDAFRKVYVAADALKMGLNIQATANVPSKTGNKPFDFAFSKGQYSVAALTDLPLDRLTERNLYRSALIDLNQGRRALTDQIDSVTSQVRQDIRNVVRARSSYEIQDSAADLAKKRVDSVNMLLDAGRASTRDLLEAQAALVEARNARSAALVAYHIARLGLMRDMEVLQVEPAGLTYHDPTTDR